jgi:putative ABC transport system permease protein
LGERGLKEGWFEIVGVVADIRQMALSQAPVPELYFSFDQIPRRQMHVLARTEVPNARILTAMREAVWTVRPDVPIRRSILMSDFAAQSIIGPRFYTLLLGSFAGVALLLALVGIYGTLAYTVSQRAHELGVRMALGATGGSVLRMILGRAMALVVFGIILGIGAAVLVTRTLESFVFGVTPTDATTMAFGVATVLVAAFLASVVPAWRAMRLDPIVTLGRE